jgi:hypothetical protein
VPEEFFYELQKVCQRTHDTKSNLIRGLLQDVVKAYEQTEELHSI